MIVVTTDVFCDVPNCGNWMHGFVGDRKDGDAARRSARAEGWNSYKGKDSCAACYGKVLMARLNSKLKRTSGI